MTIQDIDRFIVSMDLSADTFYYRALRDNNYHMETYGTIQFALRNLRQIKKGIETILETVTQEKSGTFQYVSTCEDCNCSNAGRFGGYECDMYYETTPYERIEWALNDSLVLSPLTSEIVEKSMTADLARSLGFNRFFKGVMSTMGEDGELLPVSLEESDSHDKTEFIESKMAIYRMHHFQENVELAKSICTAKEDIDSDLALIETIFTTGLSTSEFVDSLKIEAEKEYKSVLRHVERTLPKNNNTPF